MQQNERGFVFNHTLTVMPNQFLTTNMLCYIVRHLLTPSVSHTFQQLSAPSARALSKS